ncbi:Alpha/Beta hydrolase protein [Vararia minispora EC-137]|uniref:Alpha/Beta hydrolase protein n=1 Tax=Vararia minispora EC-137 TaxID=1314806 RepID=A0ACB8QEK7_9AGAM|nr:Alpha/Beta hydrolase protein [Vararia minispora EC-137]
MDCEHCFQGVRHEGTPTGAFEDIAGVKCYVATPPGAHDATKAVLFLCDAFGLTLTNNLLLCDDFARNGFKVYAPDEFEGEDVPIASFDSPEERAKLDREGWLARHSPAHNLARFKGVLDALRRQGVTRFGATGYCYGGRLVFDLVFAGEIHKYARTAAAPLLINACSDDRQYPREKQDAARVLFDGFAPGFRQAYFAGCTHGFAVRGDMSDPKVREGKEGAFKNTVEWFEVHL